MTVSIRIRTRVYNAWPKPIQDTLMTLTLRPEYESGMREVVETSFGYVQTWVAFRGRETVGWALLEQANSWNSNPKLMIYVRSDCRRMGIGKALYTRVTRDLKPTPVGVYRHDPTSTLFYNSVQGVKSGE